MENVTSMEETRSVYKFWLKPPGRRILRRTEYRWENNIKRDLGERGCVGE
jgi:hypothetical protein